MNIDRLRNNSHYKSDTVKLTDEYLDNLHGDNQDTALLIAARYDNLEIVDKICEMRPQMINVLNNKGEGVLYIAAKYSQFENLVHFLHLRKIDKSILLNGESFLDRIMENNQSNYGEDIVLGFIKKYNLNYLLTQKLCKKMCRYKIENSFGIFFKPKISEELIFAYENDDLDIFKRLFTSVGYDGFLIACQYNSNKIMEYCLENKFGINYINSTLITTAFTYACYHNNVEIASKIVEYNIENKEFLLMKDKNKKSPIEYAMNPNMNSLKLQILTMSDEDNLIDEIEIKQFKREDFIFVKYNAPNSAGGYGSAVHVIEKESGINMIIKQYNSEGEEIFKVIHSSTVNEITLIRMINKINKDVAVIIYGYYIESGQLFLVMEYLPYTLQDVFNMCKTLDKEEKSKYYKQIFTNILEITSEINSYGIVHNDLKTTNIMMNSSGKFKIIDFGLSEFYGISPLIAITNFSNMAESIKPPDNEEIREGPPSIIGKIGHKKTLNTDVYSIGIFLIVELLDTLYYRFYSDGINIYQKMVGGYKVLDFPNVDPNLVNMIKRMIHWNSSVRPYAKECLQDEYFTGISYNYERNPRPFRTILNETIIRQYTNWGDCELFYSKEIHQAYKHFKLDRIKESTVEDKDYLTVLQWGMKNINNLQVDFNTKINMIVNMIPKFLSLKDRAGPNDLHYYMIIIICFLSYQLNNNTRQLLCFLNTYFKSKGKPFLEKYFLDYVSVGDPFTYVPISTNICYLKVLLQEIGVDKHVLSELIKYISYKLIYWSFYNRGKQYEIWKIIHCCILLSGEFNYLIELYLKYYFDDVDEELLEKLRHIDLIPNKFIIE